MSLTDTFKTTPTSTLKHLIQICKDGQEGFAKAADAVTNSNMKTVFARYSLQRAKYVGELEAELLNLGAEDPQKEGGSVTGALHRGWIDLKAALSSGKPHAILEEAERGEDVAKKAYKEALEQEDLPANLREIIARQAVGVQEGHDETKALRDATA